MPKKNSNKDFDKIQKKIKNDFKESLSDTAVYYNIYMEEIYESAIQAFYNDYEPIYYQRTGATYYGSNLFDNLDAKYSPVMEGNKYIGGIVVDDKNITKNFGKPYDADTDWVFNRTYFQGIHGLTDYEKRWWGFNSYWDKKNKSKMKLSFDQWWKIKKNHYRYSQYKKYRYVGTYHLKETRKTFIVMGEDEHGKNYGSGIMRENNIWRFINMYNAGMLLGDKPADIVYKAFKKIRKPKQVNETFINIFVDKLLK